MKNKLSKLYQDYVTVPWFYNSGTKEYDRIKMEILAILRESKELMMLYKDNMSDYWISFDTDWKSEYKEHYEKICEVVIGDEYMPIRLQYLDLHSVWIFSNGEHFEDGFDM